MCWRGEEHTSKKKGRVNAFVCNLFALVWYLFLRMFVFFFSRYYHRASLTSLGYRRPNTIRPRGRWTTTKIQSKKKTEGGKKRIISGSTTSICPAALNGPLTETRKSFLLIKTTPQNYLLNAISAVKVIDILWASILSHSSNGVPERRRRRTQAEAGCSIIEISLSCFHHILNVCIVYPAYVYLHWM